MSTEESEVETKPAKAPARKPKRKPAKKKSKKASAKRVSPAKNAPDSPASELPVDYMLRVMRNGKSGETRRDQMARNAAGYIHAKPKAGDTQAQDEAERKRMEAASKSLQKKLERKTGGES
ncbi:MAG TPA: hypothetical protein VGF97_15760 [Rhizomicrobium sp.]|jgi:hypothetical protein